MRDDAAARAFGAHVRTVRMARLDAAKAALEIDRKHHFIYEGCASFGEFGERHGLSASEALSLLALGMAIERWPEVVQAVMEGRLPEESAARAGSLLKFPGGVREGEDWIGWGKGEPAKAFKRRVNRRREELRRSGPPTVERTFFVSEKGADTFEKARTIASRKAGRPLTEGEALEVVSDHYLDSFDPLRVTPGKRRMPDTETIDDRNKRGLAAEVDRLLRERNEDCCAVPYCTNKIFLENSHRVAHAAGGAREAKDLDRICRLHHDLYHAGMIRIEGTTENPIFLTRDGRPLDARSGLSQPPPPADPPPTSPSDPPGSALLPPT